MVNEDNDMSVLEYNKYLEDDAERNKYKVASEFEEMGDTFVKEIERKKKINSIRSQKLIPYIIKHSDGMYDEEELKAYSFQDIREMYDLIKKTRKPFFIKFIHFVFNIE